MASGTEGVSSDDLNSGARCRWSENSIVYTRRPRRKAAKTVDNNATSTAGKPSGDAPSTSGNPTLTHTEVSTCSENSKNGASASLPPTTTANLAETATRSDVQESVEDIVGKDGDSSERLQVRSPHQEQSLSRGSPNKDADLSQDQLQSMPSPAEDNSSAENQAQGGNGSQSAELLNVGDLPLLNRKEAGNLAKSLSPRTADEPLRTSGVGAQSIRESSTLSNDRQQLPIENDAENNGGSGPVNANGVVKHLEVSIIDDRIRFSLCKTTSKNEIKEFRNKLQCELDQIRKAVKQFEAKELQIVSYNTQISEGNISNSSNHVGAGGANTGVYSHPQPLLARSDVVDRRVVLRVNTGVGALEHQQARPMVLARMNSDIGASRNLQPRPYSRQLSVAVMENNHRASEFVEKEKRTPKANQYYRNTEFLLGKDRLPPDNNKKLKTNNGRKHSGGTEHVVGFGLGFDKGRNQMFKHCSSLLQRLMKHKHGWVFNEPVDATAMGLVDYHDIIKHPMDLGTIKARLSQNLYRSPREFADDVRLVFRNAMTYNPKGQDVHIMAEQLLEIFEERWAIIETEYNSYWKYPMYQDGGLPTPPSRKAGRQPHVARGSIPFSAPVPIPGFIPAAVQGRTSDRSEPMTTSVAFDPKPKRPHVGRTPVPKKPKAKDPNKRDMTYEEKQKLSTNLQGLPLEKLDDIVQIIKKRNTSVSQHDDEIEVDIDRVDPETLWELDRFVTNYRKTLSKKKRKAELALKVRSVDNQDVSMTVNADANPSAADVQAANGAAFQNSTAPPVDGEKQDYNENKSSSSTSSSSDSGSSSSDSDSDSSSSDESDAGHSPGT